MGKAWTEGEKESMKNLLLTLYQKENKTTTEIASELSVPPQAVFKRLKVLGIPTTPSLKGHYRNRRSDIVLPKKYSEVLAEFLGIMLGDGKLSHFQVMVTLGNKELSYARHVSALFRQVFGVSGTISRRKTGYHDVYIGSTLASNYLFTQGLVTHKVKYQVDVPGWVFSKKANMKSFVRGFFDTDGSVYKIKHGIQISFTNYSEPLLLSLHLMLLKLEYNPSQVSSHKVYITKKESIKKFFKEIIPKNSKHSERYKKIVASVV